MKFEDIDIMAKTMWGESRNQDTSGQIAVAYVIKNRAEARRWYGNTPKEVCLKDWQFSCWNEGDPNRNKMENLPIVDEVYLKMFALAHLVLEEKIKDRFTSRSGFISFYKNSIDLWTKDFKEWDCNMIGTCFELFDLEEEDINYSLREYLSERIMFNLGNTLGKDGIDLLDKKQKEIDKKELMNKQQLNLFTEQSIVNINADCLGNIANKN